MQTRRGEMEALAATHLLDSAECTSAQLHQLVDLGSPLLITLCTRRKTLSRVKVDADYVKFLNTQEVLAVHADAVAFRYSTMQHPSARTVSTCHTWSATCSYLL